MKKVLVIGTTNLYGGVGHIMFDLCKNVDGEKIQFDFLYYEKASDEAMKVIRELGGKFYLVPRYSKKPVAFVRKIKEFYATHSYDIIHVHASTAMLILYTMPVWRKKTTKIIYQSHVRSLDRKTDLFLHKMFSLLVKKHASYYAAVSSEAAYFMFGNHIAQSRPLLMLKNGIDLERFTFNVERRDILRKNLHLEDKFVIGHIGRFTYAKNHDFILRIYTEFHEKYPNTMLMLIGEGEEKERILQLIDYQKLSDSVLCLNSTSQIEDMYLVMDVFVFPSHYEGLGIVAIEAQAMGLPVVTSDQVPQEVAITEYCQFLSLTAPIDEWVDALSRFRGIDRTSKHYEVQAHGYDIQSCAGKLQNIYLEELL